MTSFFSKPGTIVLLLLSGFILATCAKENVDTRPPANPHSSEDNKSGGIYRGAIVGSTGNFSIVLQDNIRKIYVTVDGVNHILTTQAAITSGNVISGAVFTGSGLSMTFSVDANGSNPSISSIVIPNRPGAIAIVLKEISNNPVMVFEGHYTKTHAANPADYCSGNLNFVLQGNSFIACYRENVVSSPTIAGTFSGNISGNQINMSIGSAVLALTISSDKQSITGTVTDVCSSSVNCTRTL